MFIMKKIVSRLLFPLPLSLELLLVGILLLWFTRRQRAGKALVTCAGLLLLALSNVWVSGALLRPLEHRYPPCAANLGRPDGSAVRFIVVLGGWADSDPDVPITSHVAPDLMVRLIEGVRLHREIPASKLILSGNNDSADGMTEVAEALGVNENDILKLSQPKDTEEESQQVALIVRRQPFILVTSASHEPRAMGLFQKRGLQPIAAPTDYFTARHPWEPDTFFPDGYNLYKSQVAFYEYLGLAWEKLRGKI